MFKKGIIDFWMCFKYYEICLEIMSVLQWYDFVYYYFQLAFDSCLKFIREENWVQVVAIEVEFYDQ